MSTDTSSTDVTQESVDVDFDAFWQQQNRHRTSIKLAGHRVVLPAALPLQFELEAKRMAKRTDEDSVARLVSIMLGQGQYEALADAGMDSDQFKLLLAWVPIHLAGDKTLTLEKAWAQIVEAEAEKAEKEAAGVADPTTPGARKKTTSGRSSSRAGR